MRGMSLSKKVSLLAALVFLLSLAFAQSSADNIGPIASALRAREFDRALQLLQPALQQSPKNAQLWTLQGIALSGEEHEKEALASFRNALKISPDYLPALEGAAQLEYKAGSVAGIPLLQHLLQLHPDDPTSHAMLAVLLCRRGDCATAVQHFEQSGSLLDSQPSALQQYGACLVRLKQLDKAISVFSRLVTVNSADSGARNYLATVQLMAERPRDAIETLAPLLQTGDPKSGTLQLAASAYEASGDTPQAVSLLRQAIVSDPRNIDLYLDFANISMDHQSFQVGISMINSGLTLQPNAPQLYVARGVLYVQLAQYEQAEADFDKADTLDPRKAIGSAALGLEAVQKNDPDQALATVRSKLAKNPNDAYLLYLQADILNQKGPDARQFGISSGSALGEEGSLLATESRARSQSAGKTLSADGTEPRCHRGEQESAEHKSERSDGGVSPDSGTPKNRRQNRTPGFAQAACPASSGSDQARRAAQSLQVNRKQRPAEPARSTLMPALEIVHGGSLVQS